MKKISVSLVAMLVLLSLFGSLVMADNHGDMAKVRVLHASPDAPSN